MSRPKPPPLPTAAIQPPLPAPYLTWNEGDDKARAMAIGQASAALAAVEPAMRTRASNVYVDIAAPNISVRDNFDRADYDSFRWSEQNPRFAVEAMLQCQLAYQEVGIVRNIIDLMADFSGKGIMPVHPNERIQQFYRNWFAKVNGPERSERFLNVFYLLGNLIVKRQTAVLTPTQADNLRSKGDADIDVTEPIKLKKRELPWRYTIMNPMMLEMVAEQLAPFLGREYFQYMIQIPTGLAQRVKNPKPGDAELLGTLSSEILQGIKSGKRKITLDKDKTRAMFYKRFDWQSFSFPLLTPVLPDINMLKKMKLGDLVAVDGMSSTVRLWKLGDIANRIMPSQGEIQRLAEILANNVGGGTLDLIWGEAISLEETTTNAHKFLGDAKYAPVLTAIYAGLGVPPTLTGAATQSGFTNNFISLKTLTERLEYGRTMLREFWDYEIKLVQRSMGFRLPAVLSFDRMSLTDEHAEKALLVQLADRDIISWESIVDRVGECPAIEAVRLRREALKREKGQLPPKASPYHVPQQDFALEKIFAQCGAVTPSQVGVKLQENEPGQKSVVEHQMDVKKSAVPGDKKSGSPGRPKNSGDKTKRKQKQGKPRTSAFVQDLAVAEQMLADLSEVLTPAYLQSVKKKNLRQLSVEQAEVLEQFKFEALCQFELGDEISREAVGGVISKPMVIPQYIHDLFEATIARYENSMGCGPTLDLKRRFQSSVFALYRGGNDNETQNDQGGEGD